MNSIGKEQMNLNEDKSTPNHYCDAN